MSRDNGISSEETGMNREITEVATVDTCKVKWGDIKRHEGWFSTILQIKKIKQILYSI